MLLLNNFFIGCTVYAVSKRAVLRNVGFPIVVHVTVGFFGSPRFHRWRHKTIAPCKDAARTHTRHRDGAKQKKSSHNLNSAVLGAKVMLHRPNHRGRRRGENPVGDNIEAAERVQTRTRPEAKVVEKAVKQGDNQVSRKRARQQAAGDRMQLASALGTVVGVQASCPLQTAMG